jgi:thioredoxin 1
VSCTIRTDWSDGLNSAKNPAMRSISSWTEERERKKDKKQRREKMVKVVTDATFEAEVLQSSVPVVVDFFATWCGPCKMLAPILEQVSESMDGKVKFVKVDIDQNAVAENYRIQAVPTLKFFKGGQIVGESVGLVTQSALMERLKSL